jgi:hypothetical protein
VRHGWGSCAGLLVLSNREVSKDYSKKCKNKAKIEVSVAEAARVEEVSNFIKAYYTNNLLNMNPLPCYNEDENLSTLSLFTRQLRRGSAGTPNTLQQHEFRTITLYVLLNLEEVVPYRK